MTTSSNAGFEIIVPGRQNLQINAVIPDSGAPISLWQTPFFIIGEKKNTQANVRVSIQNNDNHYVYQKDIQEQNKHFVFEKIQRPEVGK